MSGIDNPLKKLKRMSRDEYKRACLNADKHENRNKEKIEKELQSIRVMVAKQFNENKERVMTKGGDDFFIFAYPLFTKTGWEKFDCDTQKKFIEILTWELGCIMKATRIWDYDTDPDIKFKIPLVKN